MRIANELKYVVFLVIFFACQVEAGTAEFCKSVTLDNGKNVRVFLKTSKLDVESFPFEDPSWWGSEGPLVTNFLSDFDVSIDGESSWVSFSAYSDLANIQKVDLKVTDKGFKITVIGGETATSYEAEIYFDDSGFLVRRVVYNPSFPNEVREETVYSFIRRQDM